MAVRRDHHVTYFCSSLLEMRGRLDAGKPAHATAKCTGQLTLRPFTASDAVASRSRSRVAHIRRSGTPNRWLPVARSCSRDLHRNSLAPGRLSSRATRARGTRCRTESVVANRGCPDHQCRAVVGLSDTQTVLGRPGRAATKLSRLESSLSRTMRLQRCRGRLGRVVSPLRSGPIYSSPNRK